MPVQLRSSCLKTISCLCLQIVAHLGLLFLLLPTAAEPAGAHLTLYVLPQVGQNPHATTARQIYCLCQRFLCLSVKIYLILCFTTAPALWQHFGQMKCGNHSILKASLVMKTIHLGIACPDFLSPRRNSSPGAFLFPHAKTPGSPVPAVI